MKKTLTIVSYQSPNNTYIKELISNLSNYYTVYWGNDFFWDGEFVSDYYIIHWPENIKVHDDRFSFSIENLKSRIKQLQGKGSKVTAFFHDKTPHFSANDYNTRLFEAVFCNVDTIYHLGNYSVGLLKKMFPGCANSNHVVIKHALFESIKNTITTAEARQHFGFGEDDFVISFLGNLRSQNEISLMYKIFKKLKISNKKLLIGGGEVNDYSSKLNFLTSRIKRYYYVGKNLKTSFGQYVSNDEIQYYYKSANVILVPRTQNLNSGVAMMAMTFGVPFVSPAVGNITELAEETGNFTFPLNDIDKAVEIIEGISKNGAPNLTISNDYKGAEVAKKIYESLEK